MGAPSRHGAVTVRAALADTMVTPVLVVDTSMGPPGATPWPAWVLKKSSSVSGTVEATLVLTLPFWLGSAGRSVRPS